MKTKFTDYVQEICINMVEGEKLGVSIRGGTKNQIGNPFDKTDEGIFISRVSSSWFYFQVRWKCFAVLILY